MSTGPVLLFPPFRFDPVNQRLWRDTQEIPLRQKTFAVLQYLVEHPDQLVTKEALLDVVWPETYVSDVVLTVCVRELRRALGDDRKTPRFIATVHGRGYRFLPAVTAEPVQSSTFKVQRAYSPIRDAQSALPLVGRETELEQLHQWLAKALDGERQIIFVSGEAGIGKTSVVEAFLNSLASSIENRPLSFPNRLDPRLQTLDASVWIGRGQCIQHYGAGEGYRPVLEALGRLCREPGGDHLIELLDRHAPTWLVQMPALLSNNALEALQRKVAGATRERMLREMAEALEVVTTERPLVLSLEDLHWSDVSTLELLSVLARRQEAARLMVLGTYRPVEMLANGHPLRTVKQELQLHRECEEQALGCLTEEHIAEYLAVRFALKGEPRLAVPLRRLAQVIHRRTEGNPLFMVNVAEYLAAQSGLGESSETVQIGVPGNLRQMIEEQIHRLSVKERRVLEAASVAGAEFSAAAVAAGTEAAVEEIEEHCEDLARREFFLRTSGSAEWPDGTVTACYSFLHALYQEVLYERLPAGQRQRLHQRIGERTEQGYGDRAREIAAELVMHFEWGGDSRKAIQYLQQAGENALRRATHQEAIDHFTKGQALLKTLPDTPERTERELRLQVSLSAPLAVVKGWSAPEVKQIMDRAWDLCQQVDEARPEIPTVLAQLAVFHLVRGELQRAHELVEQCLSLAQQQHNQHLILRASHTAGQVAVYLGKFHQARTYVERGLLLCSQFDFRAFINMLDLEVDCLHYAAQALWYLGYPDQARTRTQEGLTLARKLAHPFDVAISLGFVAEMHSLCREWGLTQAHAEEMIAITTEHAFPVYLAIGLYYRGWALAEQGQLEEGLAQMQQGIATFRATGAGLALAWRQSGLARVYSKMGQPEEGLRALAEALEIVSATDERYHEAEIYRLKGELTLQQESKAQRAKGKRSQESGVRSGQQNAENPNPHSQFLDSQGEAEACFLKAIAIAQRQQAKFWELRASISLARLWRQQGKKTKAHRMLSKIYRWFTEGFETKDLQEAKALLQELA